MGEDIDFILLLTFEQLSATVTKKGTFFINGLYKI